MDYKTAVDYLKKSMIYQMSLGSKELFHSNVWGWLIENKIKTLPTIHQLEEYTVNLGNSLFFSWCINWNWSMHIGFE